MDRIGFIGLGRMGYPMASHLLRAGFTVCAYDVRQPPVDDLARLGAVPAESPRDVAAASDVIVVMVVSDEQAREVVAGKDGLLEHARPGMVILLCSSLRPSTVRELDGLAQQHGVAVLDAPVTGGERGAVDAALNFIVGGDEEVFSRIAPIFAGMGQHWTLVGPAGSGQVVKTVNNVLLWTTLAATSEVLELARQEGVTPDQVREGMEFAPANNRWLREWWSLEPAPWTAKDLTNALAMAEEVGAQMPAAAVARELLRGWESPKQPGSGAE